MSIRSKAQSAIASAASKSLELTKRSVNKIKGVTPFNTSSTHAVRDWCVSLFVKAISKCSTEKDRTDSIVWLTLSREILGQDDLSSINKAKKIYALTDTKRLATSVFRGVGQAYQNYRQSDIPLAVKIAIPITLTAAAVLGGPSVGIAGFGSAIGMPVLLLIFLGVAGVTSVLEAVLSSQEAKNYVSIIAYMIANYEILRRSSHAMRKAMSEEMAPPSRHDLGSKDSEIKSLLLKMDPFEFERHVMSFFQDAGLFSWVTKKSNDAGVDGFARHTNRLIVVQCKRYAEENSVGRPTVQQFKGVVEENAAWRGFVVTTGYFTREAVESASKNDSLVLIGLEDLIAWHSFGIDPVQFN